MRYLMRVDTQVEESQDPVYVLSFDHDANEGRGHLTLTHKPDNAMIFASPQQGRLFWERRNKHGLSPLRSVNVEMVALELAKIIFQNQSKVLSRYRS